MIKIQVFHDCDLPSMVIGEETVEGPRRLATLFRKTLVTRKLYETHSAIWTCPVCKSEWYWTPPYRENSGSGMGTYVVRGSWMVTDRNSKWVEQGLDIDPWRS